LILGIYQSYQGLGEFVGASIREVAREANVSLSTVSKVLNAKPNAKFAPATRERVIAAAKRVGYHPNAIARGLSRKRMETIGVIMAYDQVSVTTDPYLGACLDGILHVSKQRRQKTVIFTEDSWDDTLPNLPSYCDGHCDGLLLIIPRTQSEIVFALEARNDVPFVLAGDGPESDTLTSVNVDNTAGAEEAVAHLISLGHRKIAAICGNAELRSNTQRLEGYRKALEAAEIPWRPEYLFSGHYLIQDGYDNATQLLERFPDPQDRPTAIFCLNDSIARGACDALLEAGIVIPDQMSVIGFDNSINAVSRLPFLTTIHQDVRGVGESAVRVLLGLINDEIQPGYKELLPASLVVRQTTGPVPAGSPQDIPLP
jgi:DNA-binding LacI/PurR family transcriptional regulator